MDRKLAATNYSVLERAKKNAEMTALVLVIYADRLFFVVVVIMSVVVVVEKS